MTQQQWIILVFKVALIAGFASLVGWVALYTKLARWWRTPLGWTLVTKTMLIAAMFVPSILSLFFRLNRLDSYIAGWVDAGLIGLVTPVMVWRSVVWVRLHRAGELHGAEADGGGEQAGGS